MSITTWAAAGGGWNDAQYQRAWDGPAISPAKGDITLSSTVPAGKREFFTSPGVANLEIVQSYEWDQLTSSWLDSTGDWSAGPTPQMAVGTNTSVDKADLTFTAYAPGTGIFYKFVISASTLTLTGKVPANGEGFVISPDNASIEIVQTYSWNNYGGTWAASSDNWDVAPFVPSALEAGQNQPDAGSLTLTGLAPSFNLSQLWYVPAGSMALTGFLPVSVSGHTFIPAKADLTGLGFTSWDNTSGDWASSLDSWGEGVEMPPWNAVTGDWASSQDTWSEGSLIPKVGVTYTFTIDSSGNLVFTPYGPGWPLVGDPDYIAEVIMS
tara:strand:- start:17 stop:988 length:972 start_codon:yes stop_codon:yes gene_type:complete